ncbi:hypothetical protein [Streptomyces sp. NBC_00057]|uniref:hypothetical protein n=1 Tax=Streptomyces sp. NBC_00057 TaxID=2975634 RepID=UPI003246BEAB
MHEEIAEQQADITRLLLHHIHAPFTDTVYLRGILPAPPPAEAIRIAIGAKDDRSPDQLIAYEIPLRQGGDLLTPYDIIGILRTLLTGTHLYSSDSISKLMDMTLVRVDPAVVEPAGETLDDRALTILRTIVSPYTEEQPDPRLRGFLFLGRDRLRLYLDTADVSGVIAADVRPSGAVTALLAALPSLITEEERMAVDGSDPHCSCVVDLMYW